MAASVPRKAFTTFTPNTTTFSPRGDAPEPGLLTPPPDIGFSRNEPESPESLRARLLKLFNDNQGLLLICASQFFASCMNLSVQMLNRLDPPIPLTEILVVRMCATWTITVAYMWYQDIPHFILGPPEVRFLLVTRGICGFFSVFGIYYSLQYLSLSDATVLSFLSPFVTSFAGTFFLGEAFSRRTLFAGLCSLFGVVLIARPEALFDSSGLAPGEIPHSSERGTPHERLWAVAVSMLGVFGASGAYTSLRAIGKRAHTLHSLNFFAIITVIISVILMSVGHIKPVIPPGWKWNAFLAAVFVSGFVSQFLLTTGLQRETASRGSLAMYTQIVFASMLEQIFFHARPSMLSLSGATVILSSAIYVALNKAKDEQKSGRQTGRVSQDNVSLPPDGSVVEMSANIQSRHSAFTSEERTFLLEDGLEERELQDDEDSKPSDMATHH